MTTIIGIQEEDSCTLIADNRVTDDGGRIYTHPVMKKLSEVGAFVIGGSGEVSPCDIAQHLWKPPALTAKDRQDVYHFMISKAMPSLRKCLIENGYNFDEEHDKSKDGLRFQFLIAVNGELFDIDQDLAVMKSSDGIYGVGSGAPYALGALATGADPMTAMEIAAKLTAFTSPPYQTIVQYAK